MRLLVTGGAGYIGSLLVPKLLARGHSVRVLDNGYFGVGHLRGMRPAIEIIHQDVRTVADDPRKLRILFDDCDGIIHLAAISNDPSAELVPELTEDVNYRATVVLGEAARSLGKRFIFSSSCSVYGDTDDCLDEGGVLAPLTAYARSKVASEQALLQLADRNWRPVILRNGTLYGYSPRMRFDLVINIFSLYFCLKNEIVIFGDGAQWRPFLHVGDCARAFVFFAEHSDLSHSVYNVSAENLRIADVAETFRTLYPRIKLLYADQEELDRRNYRADNQRMLDQGFRPRSDVERGINEMVEAIVSGAIPDPESTFYRNAKWLKQLTSHGIERQAEILSLLEQSARVSHAFR